jgi:hypothetical protein
LTAEQKRVRVDIAGKLLRVLASQVTYQRHDIVTLDESWVSGSASFSEKIDASSSPDRLQVAAPPFRSASSMLCVILSFSIQPSSLNRIWSRLSSSSPIFAINVTWEKSCNREILKEIETGKIFTLFPHSQTLSHPNLNNSW